MKRSMLVITMLIGFLCTQAQKVEKQKVDSTSKQSQKMFYIIWPESTWNELLKLIKDADEKPSKIKAWNDLIVQSVRPYEQKSDTTKLKK